MLKPFSRFFPGDPQDDLIMEVEMGAFRIEILDNSKVYCDDTRKLGVWRLHKTIEKLREFRRQGDVGLMKALDSLKVKQEEIAAGNDEMMKKWFADCREVWQKAYETVSEEPAPPQEPPKSLNLFNKG